MRTSLLFLISSTSAFVMNRPPSGTSRNSATNTGASNLLDDMFHVQLKSLGDTVGVCDEHFLRKDLIRGRRPRPLQLNYMFDNAKLFLEAGTSAMNSSAHEDAQAKLKYFGIGNTLHTSGSNLDSARTDMVNRMFRNMHFQLSNKRPMSPYQPLFMCGSDWLTPVTLDSYLTKTSGGVYIPSTQAAMFGKTTLREYAIQVRGIKRPDDYWWFVTSIPNYNPYFIKVPKVDFGPPSGSATPFKPNPARSNKPDLCYQSGLPGFVSYIQIKNGVLPIVMICEDVIPPLRASNKIDTTASPGTKLQDKFTADLHLFRLIMEFADAMDKLKTQTVRQNKPGVDTSTQWTKLRSNWITNKVTPARIPAAARLLAAFDRSSPELSLAEQTAIYNPANYIWFVLTAYYQSKTDFDWSSGVAVQRGGSA